MRFAIRAVSVLALGGAALYIGAVVLQTIWRVFWEQCPNTDVLSADPSLRYLLSLNILSDFHQERYFDALRPFFDAPTWPMLHNLIAVVVFALNPAGPDQRLDAAIGLAFYALTLASLLPVAAELSRDWLHGALAGLFACVMLTQSRELSAYAASAMLETQGMFFLLWTMYFLFKVYEREQLRREGASVGLPDRRLYWGLLLCSQGLLQTKYPYGLMLVMAWTALELLRSPLQLWEAGVHIWRSAGVLSRAVWLLASISVAAYALSRKWPALNSKTMKYAFYVLSMLAWVELHRIYYVRRATMRILLDRAWRGIWTWMAMPILVWLYLQPDRLSSTLGTQQRSQEAGRSYLASLSDQVFDNSGFAATLLALVALAILMAAIARVRRPGAIAWMDVLRRPLVSIAILLLLQLLVLEALTGNKQLRHLYHLLPAGLLTLAVLSLRAGDMLLPSSGRAWSWFRRGFVACGASVCISSVMLCIGEGGLFADGLFAAIRPHYVRARSMCFTGNDARLFEPVRWFAQRLPADGRYVLLNQFHDLSTLYSRLGDATPEQRATLEGRLMQGPLRAWDFDVLLRMRTYRRGDLRNDSQFEIRDWLRFDQALLLASECQDPASRQKLENRAAQMSSTVRWKKEYRHPSGDYCLELFQISKQ